MRAMLPFELLSALWFSALAVTAIAMRRRPHAERALLLSAAFVVVILLTSRMASATIRAWAGHLYLVAAYWIPSLLAAGVAGTWFEEWLVRSDAGWRQYVSGLPVWLAHICELAYLFCYPLVPIAFLVVWTNGDDADVNRFWMIVLGAGFLCYGALPWLVSRPPRLVSGEPIQVRGVARANAFVLDRVSHQLNTFPSGHVAVSVASALAVWTVSPPAGAVIGAIALGVSVGAITGRYHYVVDVIAGAAVGVLSACCAWLPALAGSRL
jgi:membrane-associated phospholipid phosphatase